MKKLFNSKLQTLSKVAMTAIALLGWSATSYAARASKATATSENPNMGLVYVSNSTTDVPTADKYVSSSTAQTYNAFGTEKSHTYYLYAKPISTGYKFDGWYDGSSLISTSTEATVTIAVSASNPALSTAAKKTWTAKFSENPAIVKVSSNLDCATAYVYPENNHPGDMVQLSVDYRVGYNGNAHVMKNQNVAFKGWYVGETCVSTDENYSFVAGDNETTVEARLENIATTPVAGKYYRIRNVANRVLSLEGNYADESSRNSNVTSTSDYNMDKYQMRWALGNRHVASDYPTGTAGNLFSQSDDNPAIDIESTPSTLFYFASGSVSAAESDFKATTITSQGVSLADITGGGYSIYARGNDYPGYYYMRRRCTMGASYNTRQVALSMGVSGENCFVKMIGGTDAKSIWNSALVFQPVDEEHLDSYWFGASASEDMKIGDSYWTSMYTAFPYQCVAEDGVEAYYVKAVAPFDGKNYAAITKIESGIVPANTPVLLKCKSTDSRHNRLLPLTQTSDNMTPIAENLLKGEFQIYTNANGNGRKSADASSMLVLTAVNGELTFVRPDNGVELKANKVWLDASALSDPNLPVLPAEGVSETVLDGYFRIQDAEGNFLNVISANGTTAAISADEAMSAAGTVFHIKAVKSWETIATVCRLTELSAQGVNMTLGTLTPGRALRSVNIENAGSTKISLTTTAETFTLIPMSDANQYFGTSLSATHAENDYTALYLDFPVTAIGDGMTCYTLLPLQKKEISGEMITYTEFSEPLTEEIPVRTPFIVELNSKNGGEVKFSVTGNNILSNFVLENPQGVLDIAEYSYGVQHAPARVASDDSPMQGVLLPTEISNDSLDWEDELNESNPLYRLQPVQLGYAKHLGFANATAGTLSANEAYLKPGEPLSNDIMLIGEPDQYMVTGIETIGADSTQKADTLYDLSGRQVVKAHSGEIYILNGKKILVK